MMKYYDVFMPDIKGVKEICFGFKEAEEVAFSFYKEYKSLVVCIERGELFPSENHLCLEADYFGDLYWRKMVTSFGTPLYLELLSKEEETHLNKLRNEKENSIFDLCQTELEDLRKEIVIGSIYLPDYENTFNISPKILSDICEGYEDFLTTDEDGNALDEDHWLDDNPTSFAKYVLEYC